MEPGPGSLGSWLLVPAIGATALSGVPALLSRGRAGERASAALAVLGGMAGLTVAGTPLSGGGTVVVTIGSFLGTRIGLAVDALSAVFLAPLFLVSALVSIYGLGYWPRAGHPASASRLRLSCGLLAASMAVVVTADSGLLLLVAWEVMALAAFFAATADDHEPAVREAGWIYLVATHTGTLALLALVAVLRAATGSFAWSAIPPGNEWLRSVVFLLALAGFGFKAGLVPIHFWLPGAHANAPSHVSALLSGVMLKMGVYGFLRVTQLLPEPPAWWGGLVLVVALLTALTGILLALRESDLKRLLAYSSVENLGIVFLGIGLALLGRAQHRPAWVALGLAAAVLHVVNHALFKTLLFLSTGALVHAHGSRDLESMGGLLRRMPRVGAAFATGSLAVCGLPPLNGFASEWLLYLGLLAAWTETGDAGSTLGGFAVAGLALVGGLAVATFVKAFGTAFLGTPRDPSRRPGHDATGALLVPLVALGPLCILLGLAPVLVAPVLDRVTAVWWDVPGLPGIGGRLAPLTTFNVAAGLVLAAAVLALGRRLRVARTGAGTWDCGYAAPSTRMQYTARSFSEWIAERVGPGFLSPARETRRPASTFPRDGAFRSVTPDPFLSRWFRPALDRAATRLEGLRILQQGRLPVYVLYVFATLLALLGWVVLRGALGR